MNDLYNTDFALWSTQQAEALRRRAANEIDWNNVAEEIEALAKSDRRDLASRIQTILDHLIRLQASPATQPRRGWERTLIVQREGIRRLLKDSPSLRHEVAGIIAEELPTVRRLALLALEEHSEVPTIDVERLSFTEVDVLGSPSAD